jgi:biopolymer transport protein ExbB/TolQ
MLENFLMPLQDTMRVISSILLIPTIIVLLGFIAWIAIELGSILVEFIWERRKTKTNISDLVDGFQGKELDEIIEKVEESKLFLRQKVALKELLKYSYLPGGSLQALARRLLTCEELHYNKITARTDLIVRLGPMLGLMGTLIPLGPGLIALGQGDTKTLAHSLVTAFDTTVMGLVTAGVAFAISRLRKRWYEDNLSATEALMESLLEVFAHGRRVEKENTY